MPSQLESGCGCQQNHPNTLTEWPAARLDFNMRDPRIKLPAVRLCTFHTLHQYGVWRDGDTLKIGGVSSVAKKSNAYRDQLKTHEGKHHP